MKRKIDMSGVLPLPLNTRHVVKMTEGVDRKERTPELGVRNTEDTREPEW